MCMSMCMCMRMCMCNCMCICMCMCIWICICMCICICMSQSLATVFIIIFVFPSPRPLPCINKKFMNSDGHQMAWTVRSARVYRIQRSKSIKLNTDSRVVPWQLEEKYISYHSPTIKNDITRSDARKRRRNSVKSSDVGRQKVPCTS